MNAARSAPLLLAENDNALDDSGVSSSPRARIALRSPLTREGAVPAPACRAFHEVAGQRLFSSIVAVEQYGGPPCWRASVTLWGRPNEERRELALHLAYELLSGVGIGAFAVEQRGSVTFVRRPLSARERLVLRPSATPLAGSSSRKLHIEP